MGWLVIDIYIMYFFKASIRVIDFFGSLRWERKTALVTGQIVMDPAWGCSSVKLFYKFLPDIHADGQSIKGWDEIPFQMRMHSRTYAASFTHNLPRTIRVNPRNMQETRFFEWDQRGRLAGNFLNEEEKPLAATGGSKGAA